MQNGFYPRIEAGLFDLEKSRVERFKEIPDKNVTGT
jgi:hypothetical protein